MMINGGFITKAWLGVRGIFVCHKLLITSEFSFTKDKEVSVESSGCFSGSVDMKYHIKQTRVHFPDRYLVIRYQRCLGEAVKVFLRHRSLFVWMPSCVTYARAAQGEAKVLAFVLFSLTRQSDYCQLLVSCELYSCRNIPPLK